MGYVSIPPTMSELFWDLDKRIGRLETSFRFNCPNVNILTNPPTNPNKGDLYYDLDTNRLVFWTGTHWHKVNSANY